MKSGPGESKANRLAPVCSSACHPCAVAAFATSAYVLVHTCAAYQLALDNPIHFQQRHHCQLCFANHARAAPAVAHQGAAGLHLRRSLSPASLRLLASPNGTAALHFAGNLPWRRANLASLRFNRGAGRLPRRAAAPRRCDRPGRRDAPWRGNHCQLGGAAAGAHRRAAPEAGRPSGGWYIQFCVGDA